MPQAIGDAKKASIYVLSNGVAAENSASNISKLPGEIDATLVGTVKDGQDVTVTSKGTDTVGKTTVAWDLKIKTKVLAAK